MSQTRWNKATTITNSDNWNLSADLATEADTLNVTVPVASDTERNGLLPPQGLYAGMRVGRTDKPGVPTEVRDSGGTWNLHPLLKIWANSNVYTGSASSLLSDLQAGRQVAILQAGSVVATADVNGYGNFAWPQAFPNGLITVVVSNGDDNATGKQYMVNLGSASQNLTTCYFNINANGTPLSGTVRINYIAIGW